MENDLRMREVRRPTLTAIILASLLMCIACSSHFTEEMRISSSDGRFDAVMTRDDSGGAAVGFDWRVDIVPKGKPISVRATPVFSAGTLSHETLKWKQGHLLEIGYDTADIETFRNVSCNSEISDARPPNDYCVEIQLKPLTDYSIITPDGEFRHVRP